MNPIGIFCVLAAALGSVAALGSDAQTTPPRSVIASLVGDWRGTGVVTGRDSTITLSWSTDVGGAFLHLRFRNDMAAGGSRPAEVFEGRGYYRLAGAGPAAEAGTWLDSRGMIFPVSFSLSADALTSDWGSPTTERGRTVYRVTDDGALEVVDSVRTADGQYREFGRSRLARGK